MKRYNLQYGKGNTRMDKVNRPGIDIESTLTLQNAKIGSPQVEELKLYEWNGFVELTDECCFGLALFELRSEHLYTKIVVPLKDLKVEREINIILMGNLHKTEVAFTSGRHVTVPLPYIDAFAVMGVAQFIHETKMVGKLMSDIKELRSVRDRWLPNFIGSLDEIEEVLNSPKYFRVPKPEMMGSSLFAYTPTTIGQYILLAMCERLRKRIRKGLSLRTLIYLLALITRFARDRNHESLSLLLHNAVVWITQSTCDDCLIKTMRYLHGQRSFEYSYHLSDSFAKYIKFQSAKSINMSISSTCPEEGMVKMTDEQKRCFLRSIGTHAFLVSPDANKRIAVLIKYSEMYPENRIFPTAREMVSLLSILDLHARVLRAHDWNQSIAAFNAWWSERRMEMTSDSNEFMSLMIDDLISLRRQSEEMRGCTSHLICLLARGVLLQREMIANYHARNPNERAHEFLVRFVFYVAPSPSMRAFADMHYKRFLNMSPEDRRLEISFTIENSKHSYALCPPGVIGPISSKLKITKRDRILYIDDQLNIENAFPTPVKTPRLSHPPESPESSIDGTLLSKRDKGNSLKPLPQHWSDDDDNMSDLHEEEFKSDREVVDKVISRLNLKISGTNISNDDLAAAGPSGSTSYYEIEHLVPEKELPRTSTICKASGGV